MTRPSGLNYSRRRPAQVNPKGKCGNRDAPGLFNLKKPKPNRCCMCDSFINGDAITEYRPTGRDFKLQTWYYCGACDAKSRTADIRLLQQGDKTSGSEQDTFRIPGA
jgi:hypothetical protein